MNVESIAVIGAGTMGNGIAQVCAVRGFPVIMTDVARPALERGLATISGSLDRLVNRQKLTQADKEAALARISTATTLEATRDCDLIIEAATENPELKLRIFGRSDEHTSELQ